MPGPTAPSSGPAAPPADEVARHALRLVARWGGDAGSLHSAGGGPNQVFGFASPAGPRFLRLTPAHSRPLAQVEAELDYVAWLARGGVPVAVPVPAPGGAAAETVRIGAETFTACVFENAPGARFEHHAGTDDGGHFRALGRVVGEMHRRAAGYAPPAGRARAHWRDDDLFRHPERWLPPSETVMWRELREVMDLLGPGDGPAGSHGLIHGDLGPSNYRCAEGRVTLFDFDDCCHHRFAYDLACLAFFYGWSGDTAAIVDQLAEGYAAAGGPPAPPQSELALLCRLRGLHVFLFFARQRGVSGLSSSRAAWMDRQRERTARGIPPFPS